MSYQRSDNSLVRAARAFGVNLCIEDFNSIADELYIEYQASIYQGEDGGYWLGRICQLFDKYMPLFKYEAYELDNAEIKEYIDDFRRNLIGFYADGWEEARWHYNNLYDRDITPEEVDDLYTSDEEDDEYDDEDDEYRFDFIGLEDELDRAPVCAPAA